MTGTEKNSDVSRRINVRSGADTFEWQVANERPVAFIYNDRNYAVMMATPQDIEDFAFGFSLSEAIVNAPDEILDISINDVDVGFDVKISISPERLERFDIVQGRRNLVGSAGCGLCGMENADRFLRALPPVAPQKTSLDVMLIQKALAEFEQYQPLNQKTRSVHGAAWVSPEGGIAFVREDIGRHNAVDKLLGSRARSDGYTDGFMLVSSRCSYEIIEKAARHGVRAIVSISAPTGYAIDRADEANIALYCQSESGPVAINV